MVQTSGKPNSQASCWLLPLRRTTVRRNGKAFWFNLPLLVYKAFLFSLTFFYTISLPIVPAGFYYFSKVQKTPLQEALLY